MTDNKDIKRAAGRYQVIVTADHLTKGNGIYHAVAEMFPGFKVKVLRTSVQMFPDRGNKGLYGKMPPIAIEMGHRIDHSMPVMAFSFELVLAV